MAVTTSAHLRERIYELLVDGAGVTRTLAAAYRFQRRKTSLADRTVLAVRAREKPLVDVVLTPIIADTGVADELADSHIYTLTVNVFRYYFLGWESDPEAVDATQDRIADDLMRTRAVLCHPANLAATEAGDDTGLDGSSLSPAGGRSAPDRSPPGDGRDRLVIATDTYTATFNYAPDGA